jgi:hypothetical protein
VSISNTLRYSDAYNEGYDAYENGFIKNPYPEGTHERDSSDHQQHMDWEMGWGGAWAYWNDDPA